MKGAFQVSREIFENPIWSDIPKFRIFFFIVGNAVFSPEGVRKGGILIKRGQYLRSYRNLRDDLEYIDNRAVKKYSTSVIKRKIDQLVKEERLKIEDTELGTLFTVVNYDLYQGFNNYKESNLEQRENSVGTVEEQRENNNKNVKNVKNESIVINNDRDPIDLIAERYADLKTMQTGRPSYPNPKDYQAIAQIVARGVPTSQTIKLLEQCFDDFNQQNEGDTITSFRYCQKFINNHLDRLAAIDQAKEDAKKGETHEPRKQEFRRGNGYSSRQNGKSYEQAMRELEADKQAWGG